MAKSIYLLANRYPRHRDVSEILRRIVIVFGEMLCYDDVSVYFGFGRTLTAQCKVCIPDSWAAIPPLEIVNGPHLVSVEHSGLPPLRQSRPDGAWRLARCWLVQCHNPRFRLTDRVWSACLS